MANKPLRPKFLTEPIANVCVTHILNMVLHDGIQGITKDENCYVVVLVPSMKDDGPGYPAYPNYQIEPYVLYEFGLGPEEAWSHPFDDIAKCKALQLWHGRNDGGTDVMPHLLFPGDTPFWGGVKRHGIVVAVSGFQPHIDRMVAGMAADMMVGMAYEAWMQSTDKKNDVNFLLEDEDWREAKQL